MSELLYEPRFGESLTQYVDQGEQFSIALTGNVMKHDDARDGFKPQPYDIRAFPYQRPDCIRVSGVNAGPDVLRGLASVVYPKVDQIIDTYKARPDLLNHIYDKLEDGKDIGVVTDHSNVIGVAIAGGALACALYEKGYIAPDELRTGIFVSSMIKHTQLLGSMPTVDVLAGIFSETFFSLPPTESVRSAEIPKAYRDDFNTETKTDFSNELDKDDAMLIMLAGSGSRDKLGTRRFRRKQMFMGPLANGTVDILKRLYSLPVGIDIRDEKPEIHIGQLHRPIKSEEEAHNIMQSIAAGMSDSTRLKRKYYRTRELFQSAWEDTEEFKRSQVNAKN